MRSRFRLLVGHRSKLGDERPPEILDLVMQCVVGAVQNFAVELDPAAQAVFAVRFSDQNKNNKCQVTKSEQCPNNLYDQVGKFSFNRTARACSAPSPASW